jgi:hypothetical protein
VKAGVRGVGVEGPVGIDGLIIVIERDQEVVVVVVVVGVSLAKLGRWGRVWGCGALIRAVGGRDCQRAFLLRIKENCVWRWRS